MDLLGAGRKEQFKMNEEKQAYKIVSESVDFRVVDPDGNTIKTFSDPYSPKAFVSALNSAYMRGWKAGMETAREIAITAKASA